jgi:phosphoglycerate dehydrogenase-like enzyme
MSDPNEEAGRDLERTGDGAATPDVVVLNQATHGMPASDYLAELRERLPGYDVRLGRTPAEERALVEGAPVVTGVGIDEDLLAAADDLRLFACASAGVGHLPMARLEERGVAVTNGSGVHGPNIAEHVLGWVLTFLRRLDEGRRRQQRREWRHFQSVGELRGSTVTVVGLGAIGRALVRRLDGFGVETIGVRYTPSKGGPTDRVVGFERDVLHDALAETDVLVLATPLTDATRGLIGEEALRTLPTDAILVNVARGPVVDTDALVGALRRNGLHGAALDVTDPEPLPEDHPLWGFENVFLTPHVSGHTPHYWERVADVLARNLETVERTGDYADLENQVA